MTNVLSVLVPVVAAVWALNIGIVIAVGRRRRADPSYRAATMVLVGFAVTFLIASVGAICVRLLTKSVPLDRIVRVLLLYDTGPDTMLLRFGLIGAYGITIFAVIQTFRQRGK